MLRLERVNIIYVSELDSRLLFFINNTDDEEEEEEEEKKKQIKNNKNIIIITNNNNNNNNNNDDKMQHFGVSKCISRRYAEIDYSPPIASLERNQPTCNRCHRTHLLEAARTYPQRRHRLGGTYCQQVRLCQSPSFLLRSGKL